MPVVFYSVVHAPKITVNYNTKGAAIRELFEMLNHRFAQERIKSEFDYNKIINNVINEFVLEAVNNIE